jgi:hypothetical protein
VTTVLPAVANTIKTIKNNIVKCFTILVKQLLGRVCVCVFMYYRCFNGYKLWFRAVRGEHKFWKNNLYKMGEVRAEKS